MSTQNGEFESSCTCAICMEELGTQISSCPCGHVYHSSCIKTWIKQKKLCPQCKGEGLPLTPLKFNLFHISKEEKALSAHERMSSIKSNLTSVTLSIDNEIAEINVLEPQLAECKEEERAYTEGISAREQRKLVLERELESVRFSVFEAEKRHKNLNEEVESMREKLYRVSAGFDGVPDQARRPIQSSEIPKIMNFLLADAKKIKEIEKEKSGLNSQILLFKNKLSIITKKIKDLGIFQNQNNIHSKNINYRLEGFVPIDSFGKKRRLEKLLLHSEEQLPTHNTLENLKPSNQQPLGNTIEVLSLLVSCLSDDEDNSLVDDIIELDYFYPVITLTVRKMVPSIHKPKYLVRFSLADCRIVYVIPPPPQSIVSVMILYTKLVYVFRARSGHCNYIQQRLVYKTRPAT